MNLLTTGGSFGKGGSLVKEHGFLDSWLRFCEPFEYPDSYAMFSMLACAACAVDGRIQVNPRTEPSPLTNLYVVLYGPSGSRKSTAIRHAVALLGEAVPEAPILPSSFTKEALIGALARDSAAHGRAPGLIVTEELADLLGGGDYCLHTTKFLTQIWDCRPVWVNETRTHGVETITHPYPNLLAASAHDWLAGVDPSSLAGGMLRRMLLVAAHGPKRENAHPIADNMRWDELVRQFRVRMCPTNIPLLRSAAHPAHMRLSQEAGQFMEEWYTGRLSALRKGRTDKEGHFINTLQTHALKVGALVHLLEGEPYHTLSVESLKTGINLVESLLPGTFEAYTALVPTPFARLRGAIMRTVREMGEGSDAEIDRAVTASVGARPKEVAEARASLLIDESLVRQNSGKIRAGS